MNIRLDMETEVLAATAIAPQMFHWDTARQYVGYE